MYDNPSITCLCNYSRSSHATTHPGKPFDTIVPTPPPELDMSSMSSKDERVAMLPTNGAISPVSPQTLAITPSIPASPTPSDADSECLDDASNSPCSFTGEECPDFCGGPKHSCRSWTPPASPYYYTNENGIFIVDDRQNFEQRQKIELEHTLRNLAERLEQLRDSVSPARFIDGLHELEDSTLLSSGGNVYESSKKSPPSPNKGNVGNSRNMTVSPEPYPCNCGGIQRPCQICATQYISANSSQHEMNTEEKGEMRSTDLGKLIHTSLQHVQTTNSPPRYLTNVTERGTQSLPTKPTAAPNSHGKLHDEALPTKHASPQLHLGNTAYPTPLPSSPETRPSRKRGRTEGFQEGSGRKRRREENDEWVSTALESAQSIPLGDDYATCC